MTLRRFQDRFADHLTPLSLAVGEVLVREGESCDALYLVIDGQLALRRDGRLVANLGRGQVLAESGLALGGTWQCSAEATRASSVFRLPQSAWLRLLDEHPREALALAAPLQPTPSSAPRAITLVPLSSDAHAGDYLKRLVEALAPYARVTLVTREAATRAVGADALRPGNLALHSWLAAQDDQRDLLIFLADMEPTPWSELCLRQADLVLLLAEAEQPPARTPLEQTLLDGQLTRAPIDLVLTYPQRSSRPTGTAAWLEPRRLRLHHHVADRQDLERLARVLTGRAVQVVLSGGGARCFAQLGVLRALREAQLPVDFVAGVSMGASISALHALEQTPEQIQETIRERLIRDRRVKDVTFPMLSLYSGRGLSRVLREVTGNANIEDLRLDWFGLSADLRSLEDVVHTRGPLWEALRASGALPGAFPPVVRGDRCLVDGGALNNLPVDVMAARAPGRILAIDCADGGFPALDVETAAASGWTLLWRRLFSWRRPQPPHVGRVMLRSAGISTQRIVRHVVAQTPGVLHVQPPVARFGLMAFDQVDDIVEVGYRFANEHLSEWKERLTESSPVATQSRAAHKVAV